MINEQLFNLYYSRLNGLNLFYSKLDLLNIKEYVGPLMIYCWEELYNASKYKTMIVGQETNGWYDGYVKTKNDIEYCIGTYKSFKPGVANPKTLFWKYSCLFNTMINDCCNETNFIWSNINKFGSTGKGRPVSEVTDMENKEFNVFTNEIQILKPDVCLFFTGPRYDDDIKNKVNDVEFVPFENFSERQLVKVKSSFLPPNSYRTYHPGYGNRIKKLYMKIFKAIINDIEGCV